MGSQSLTLTRLTPQQTTIFAQIKMNFSLSAVCVVVLAIMVLPSLSVPVIENPYLSILINRRDLGHSFDLGVDRSNNNLIITGPPAPYVGFPGTSTYYQRSYGHVTPFVAFGNSYNAQQPKYT